MSFGAQRLLQNQFKQLMKEPVEGFTVEIPDESNMFEWDVYIQGPQDTEFEGGIFKAKMSFPQDYPYKPPELRFVSDFWHPNVYTDGKVCISILHPPGDDPMSGERPEERWSPAQSVTTILLSVISLLADPNISSPANVDASVEWRRHRDTYKARIKKLVEKSKKEAPPGLTFPKPTRKPSMRSPNLMDDDNIEYIEEDDDIDYENEAEEVEYEEIEVVEYVEDTGDSTQ